MEQASGCQIWTLALQSLHGNLNGSPIQNSSPEPYPYPPARYWQPGAPQPPGLGLKG